MIRLAEIRLKQPIAFSGPSTLTITDKEGILELDPNVGLIFAKRRSGTDQRTKIVPVGNVSFMVELPKEVAAPAPEPEKVPEPPPAPIEDTVKFEKTENGIRQVAAQVAKAKKE